MACNCTKTTTAIRAGKSGSVPVVQVVAQPVIKPASAPKTVARTSSHTTGSVRSGRSDLDKYRDQ